MFLKFTKHDVVFLGKLQSNDYVNSSPVVGCFFEEPKTIITQGLGNFYQIHSFLFCIFDFKQVTR